MKNRLNKYYKTRIITEELIKEGINYTIRTNIFKRFSKELDSTNVYITIKPKNEDIKEEINIKINEDKDNGYLYDSIKTLDKVRIWDFGFDDTKYYRIKEAVEYIKYAIKNRISVFGIDKEINIKGWNYYDLKDINKLDEFIEKLKEKMDIERVTTFEDVIIIK